jgi:hypothetical protein
MKPCKQGSHEHHIREVVTEHSGERSDIRKTISEMIIDVINKRSHYVHARSVLRDLNDPETKLAREEFLRLAGETWEVALEAANKAAISARCNLFYLMSENEHDPAADAIGHYALRLWGHDESRTLGDCFKQAIDEARRAKGRKQ